MSLGASSPISRDYIDSPEVFALEKINSIDTRQSATIVTDNDGPSAADYDPTADMQEDGRRDELRQGQLYLHTRSVNISDSQLIRPTEPDSSQSSDVNHFTGVHPVVNVEVTSDGDGDFDMFAEDFDDSKYTAAAGPVHASRNQPLDGSIATKAVLAHVSDTCAPTNTISAAPDGALLEDDDREGYYKIRPGEILDGRYQLQAAVGKGMFSGVARALDVKSGKAVAIKMMRNNDALRKGGFTEVAILQKLNDADPDDRRHIVRFLHHFDFKGHLCLAFENLGMNLREVLRKFGNNVGINIEATRAYAYQIFIALSHMRSCSIVHADIKPDNILVSENRSVVKICDLGTAIDRSDAATALDRVTPYLVSRFYRAPELILGMPFDHGVDMWSVGCTLYELYTGKILFTGDSNNQMLKTIMETRGRIMPKLLKRGQLSDHHFDHTGSFLSVEQDKFGKACTHQYVTF